MTTTTNSENQVLDMLIQAAEIIQNGVIWLNSDGHILGVNSQLAEELGYPKSDFSPRTIFEINPSTSFLSWRKLWKQLLEEQQFTTETEQLTADNSIYPVTMRGTLLHLGEQKVCMTIIENLMASNRYKDLLDLTSEMANIGSWEWDLVQNDFIFSDETFRLLGLPSDTKLSQSSVLEIVGKLISGKDLEDFKNQVTTAIKSGKGFEAEYSLMVNGQYSTYTLSAKPVWLEDQTIKIFGTLQNMAKIAKRTDELYFTRYCMDNSREMIFWMDPKGKIEYVNKAVCEKLNYAQHELLGQSVEIISPYSLDQLGQHWKELKKEGALEFETVHQTKDGRAIQVSIMANYMSYKGKEFNCGFVRDLTLKKEKEGIIAIAKKTLDQSIDMIFWLRPDATFRYFNDAFAQKTGYSRAEIQKKTIVDFFPETTMEDFKKGWIKLQEGKILESADRKLLLKDGTMIDTEISVSLVKVGEKEYSTTLLRDVTVRRQKERERGDYVKQIEELQAHTAAQNIELQEEINLEFNFNNIISKDPNYKKVLRQVEQVAETDATVLILGETGTGKELLARSVHQLSIRSDKPLIKVNCGALPENLIESELFGHEKGAFTGAYKRKIGKFELAHQGTIFLDEIGELPLDLQTNLLRVLQEGEIERVGGNDLIQLDVRVIAATNRNLEELVKKKKFREDLYYRLNVFPIHNIPLRERPEDIPILVKHFAEKYSRKMNKEITEISAASLNKLMSYSFMGNVRELENLVERAVILANRKILTFGAVLSHRSQSNTPSKFKTLEEAQKEHIINALKRTGGKVSGKMGAAELLNINDKTLTSRMKKLGISKKDYLKPEKS